MMRRLHRFLIGFIVIIVLILGGAVFQAVVSPLEMQAYPAPGELVDVGGYRLHWYCVGSGETTVVLIHALGGNIIHWALAQPEIAQSTRVCAYDRAGYGWSESGVQPRTVVQNVEELHTLLQNTSTQGPIILVGHSYGTHVAQLYAVTYPQQVIGLVLVDGGITSTEAAICAGLEGCLPEAARSGADMVIGAMPVFTRIGLGRLLNQIMPYGESLRFLSTEQQNTYAALVNQTKAADANAAEWVNWETPAVGEPASLGDLPLVVIYAEATFPAWVYGDDTALWQQRDTQLYEAIRDLSRQGRLEIVAGADHASLIFDPQQRLILVEALASMLQP